MLAIEIVVVLMLGAATWLALIFGPLMVENEPNPPTWDKGPVVRPGKVTKDTGWC